MTTANWKSDDGTVQLYLGDCLQVLPTLAPEVADAVIVDPPYGIDYQSARRIDRATWKPKIANDKQIGTVLNLMTKPSQGNPTPHNPASIIRKL